MPHRKGGLWVDRVCQAIPGFNTRSYNLFDCFQLCERLGIVADEMPLRRLHGVSFYDEAQQPFLFVNSLLSDAEKIVAAWHEYAHLLLHETDTEVFCSTGDLWNHGKIERQAETVGVIALLPQHMLHEDLSEYPRRIVEYRGRVWRDLQM